MEEKKKSEDTECYETDRLYIRHFKVDDTASCMVGWGQDRNLNRFIMGYPMTREEMQSFVEIFSENENAWLIKEKKNNNNSIGYVTIDISCPQLQIGEIGYVIGEKYQNRGYAYEAIVKLLNIYFEQKNMYMIEAKYNEINICSAKLLKKLGFQIDGILRERRIDMETMERKNMIVCSITNREMTDQHNNV